MNLAERLSQLGLELPTPPEPVATYKPYRRDGRTVYFSGTTTGGFKGRLGENVSIEDGYTSARLAMLNSLANLSRIIEDTDEVEQVLKVVGFVNSAPGFPDQPAVVNGATDLLKEVFGDKGIPARSAVGVAALPGNASVEVEMIVQLRE